MQLRVRPGQPPSLAQQLRGVNQMLQDVIAEDGVKRRIEGRKHQLGTPAQHFVVYVPGLASRFGVELDPYKRPASRGPQGGSDRARAATHVERASDGESQTRQWL